MSTASFIAAIKDQAQALHAAGSCFASITIAQGIWESANGTSYVCQHANNLFGITGKYNGQSLLYHGYRYRVYPDWPTCIQDHADFLKAPRYVNVINAKTYTDAANALHTAGYAEDPDYAKGIIATIERYKLYEYDVLPTASGGYTPPPDTVQKKNTDNAEVSKNMIDMQKAVDHVIMVANDNSRGYSQTRRAEEKEDDCSSLTLDALKLAGVNIGSATYTGNALQPLLAAGFQNVTSSVNLKTGAGLKKFDVLLRPATPDRGGHMALMVTDTDLAQAAGDLDKKRGDSSGKEIYIRTFVGAFSTPPKYVLRLPVPVSEDPDTIRVGDLVDIVVPYNTSSDGSGISKNWITKTGKAIKIVTGTSFPFGVCYNDDNFIDGWFKKENLRKRG